ncbi:MAG: glutaredoxin [Acidobacteria bacterium]|nr:glutaredoxin [Acidobacteriota bacterium]|tara:strand:+ start:8716 stop:8958 length:243 start_codon:yes stop_codon:yes gene_type:complete
MVEIFGFDERIKKCRSCINAKRFCKVKNIDYTFHSVNDDDNLKLLMSKMGLEESRGLTMPQIFDDGKHIGGFTDFKKYKK